MSKTGQIFETGAGKWLGMQDDEIRWYSSRDKALTIPFEEFSSFVKKLRYTTLEFIPIENSKKDDNIRVLSEAKSLIQNVGWCKHQNMLLNDGTNEPMAYCMVGAIVDASRSMERSVRQKIVNECLTMVDIAINENLDEKMNIDEFNDHRETTKEDVLNIFSKVIEEYTE